MALIPGSRLGSHRLVTRVRADRHGESWRARDDDAGTTVSVLVLETAPEALRAAVGLRHPNLRALHDLGFESGVGFLVLETLSGETLAEKLARSSLPAATILDLACGIAAGLAALHEVGLVHGNLDPEKVFLDGGAPKLVDFGLGRTPGSFPPPIPHRPDGSCRTDAGVASRFGYVAPEELRGEPAGARGDVFSFGAILDGMVSGPLSIEGPGSSVPHSSIPEALRRLIARCLATDPNQRFRNAVELRAAVEEIVRETRRTESARVAVQIQRRRRIAAGWVLAVGISGAALFGGMWTGTPALATVPPAAVPAPAAEKVASSDMSEEPSPLPDHGTDPQFGRARGLGE